MTGGNAAPGQIASQILVRNKLTAAHAGATSSLYRMIASKTAANRHANSASVEFSTFWRAEWWGLNNSVVYNRMTTEHQENVLAQCNRSLLTEAYFIEKSGLAYCAKLLLDARDTDEAQLYALIAADEAKHLAWLEPYLSPKEKTSPSGLFLQFLTSLIEEYPSRLLAYLVQVILEGWGLDHYNRLARNCCDTTLAEIFQLILKDEALHHHSGTLLFDAKIMTDDDLVLLESALRTYTDMVRVGPQTVLDIVDREASDLTSEDLMDVLVALNHESETKRKLNLLKNLMCRPGLDSIIQRLDKLGCFEPLTLQEAAAMRASTRSPTKN